MMMMYETICTIRSLVYLLVVETLSVLRALILLTFLKYEINSMTRYVIQRNSFISIYWSYAVTSNYARITLTQILGLPMHFDK